MHKALRDMYKEMNIRIERNAEQKEGVKKALDSFAQDVTKKLQKISWQTEQLKL